MQTMKSTRHPRRAAMLLAAAALVLAPTLVAAQAIYRIVGPDGRVTFSDTRPSADAKATPLAAGGRSASSSVATGDLPFDLREVVTRYPVTLYTGDNCEPCNSARSLLSSRGVPYTEKTIKTARDVEALKGMGMEATVPVATIGGQRLKGFSESEWSEYLDAAGYPKTSRLPGGYRNPPASPLVAVPEPAPAPAATRAPAAAPVQPILPPSGPTPDNPTGIVF